RRVGGGAAVAGAVAPADHRGVVGGRGAGVGVGEVEQHHVPGGDARRRAGRGQRPGAQRRVADSRLRAGHAAPEDVVVVAAVVALEHHGAEGGRPGGVGVRVHQLPVDEVVDLAAGADAEADLVPLVGAGEARDVRPAVRLVEDPEAAGARAGLVIEANDRVYAVEAARGIDPRRPEAGQGPPGGRVAVGVLLGQAGPGRRHVQVGGDVGGARSEVVLAALEVVEPGVVRGRAATVLVAGADELIQHAGP